MISSLKYIEKRTRNVCVIHGLLYTNGHIIKIEYTIRRRKNSESGHYIQIATIKEATMFEVKIGVW